MKANDAILKNMQTNMTSLTNSNLELKNMFDQFMKMNTASSSGSGTLSGNTITNPKEDLKGITTRSGTAYQRPTIPTTSFSRVVECETEATKDTVHPANNESTEDVQPSVVPTESPILNSEPVVSPIIEPVASPDLNFNISFADALILMPKFGPSIKSLLTNKDKLCELARTPLNEHCSVVLLKKLPEKLGDLDKFLIPCDFPRMTECLALADLDASINLMPLFVWNKLSLPDLSPTCMTLELVDRSISRPVGVAEDVFVKVGTFHFPANFVVVDFDADPRVPLILERSFLKTERALIDVFEGELTLRVGKEAITFNLDQTSRYSANYNDMIANRIDVIDMACEEYSQEVLGFFDMIASGNPTPYYYPIVSTTSSTLNQFGNSDFLIIAKDLSVEEKTALITVLKSHKRAIAWKLSDNKGIDPEFCTHKFLWKRTSNQRPWVSAVHCIPKKGGFTVVENEDNELIPARLVTGWRVYIDYHQEKPHSPAHTERLLTATCLLGYAMHRTRFREKMLKRCEDTNLFLNWEKSHFMVKEGIVFGHKISKEGIKVDKAKVEVITKLPHPTTVKGIRSFLGHAGFYRRFVKDFLKIAQPMTRFLEKDTPLLFSKGCVKSFQTLKRKLTEARILIAPDWDMPFELMCDASDFVIGAVLGQRQEKHFRTIHYAKNLAADHLSRLENPHQNVLDPKEINESFPTETLNMVSTRGNQSTPWFADFANYHAGNFIVKGMSSQQKNKSTS
nr:reverse transcriptase domain-containing protein [Tanacetum cinerariifolium]